MKKSLFLLSFVWLFMFAFSQAPSGINYQTVIRASDGQVMANAGLTLKMTIRTGTPDGQAVYVEIHNVVSNVFGLVNLVIGQGSPQFTDFSAIRWGNAPHYLEIAIDFTGGGQFTILCVTQFVSVPYSLYSGQSGGILNMTDQERAAIVNPPAGMQIFNLSTRCINYFDGYDWFQTCGSLILNQPPELPYIMWPPNGEVNLPFEINLQWMCNDPEFDHLVFDVYFGPNYPPPLIESSFSPLSYLVSQLQYATQYFWKVVAHDSYGNTTEGPVWSFFTAFCTPTPVYAGQDATICSNSSYYIQDANTGGAWNFIWTTGGDGTFENPTTINTLYMPGMQDVLTGFAELTLTAYDNDPCPLISGSDAMIISFAYDPTVHAGNDQTVCTGEVVQLSAIATNYNQVQWIAVDGSDDFSNQYSLTTEYYPNINELNRGYSEIGVFVSPIEPCYNNAFDYIFIYYESLPTVNAGPDQLSIAGTTATLEGNAPPNGGYGIWSISSGTGGSIAQPNNPTSTFTGFAGNSYTLKWTVNSLQGCVANDDVIISFASNWACGQSFTDTRDGKLYTTVQIGTQCWMKQNLNVGTRIAGTSNQSNNATTEKYCYNNTESNCATYGGLYQWDEMMQYTTTAGVKGICPTGWHLPTDAEWTTLTTYVSSQTAYHCNSNVDYIAKSLAATTNWNTNTGTCTIGNNLNANNATGFTGLPGGYRTSIGTFGYLGDTNHFWSSTQLLAASAWNRHLYYSVANVNIDSSTKGYGFSVRCVKD
jgi:uncharacterized protein (TIGR02145 family)